MGSIFLNAPPSWVVLSQDSSGDESKAQMIGIPVEDEKPDNDAPPKDQQVIPKAPQPVAPTPAESKTTGKAAVMEAKGWGVERFFLVEVFFF